MCLAWTADGSEIVYVALDPASGDASLQAALIASGARHRIDTAQPLWTTSLARGADGSALYYVIVTGGTAGAPVYGIREAISGNDIASDVPPSNGDDLVLSPDGHRLLYSARADHLLLDLEQGTSTATGCVWHPALEPMPVFSPAGDRLLCERFVAPNTSGLATIGLTDGTPHDLTAPPLTWRATHWDAAGIHMAGWDWRGSGFSIVDPVTGESSVVYRSAGITNIGMTAAFSPDGEEVGFWLEECLASDGGLLSCSRAEEQLVVVDLVTGLARTIASGSPPAGAIAFSDDGRHIAYQFGSELHVRATAP
jgi:hypothetical protein